MNEQLSCWVDGELDDLAAGRILRSLKQEDSVQQDAELAYLIGDAIRGEMSLGAGFMGRFSEALQAEPTVIAPGAAAGKKAEHVNRRVFALSAAASVAAFMVVGWFAARTGSMVAPGAAGPAAVARLEVPELLDELGRADVADCKSVSHAKRAGDGQHPNRRRPCDQAP